MARKKAAKSEETNAMDETQNNSEGETMNSGRKKTVRQYWIEVLTAHPSWLQERSNERLFKEYLKDHPEDEDVPTKARQGLSTVKSLMRKEFKDRKRGRKVEAENDASAPVTTTGAVAPTRRRTHSALENLEERIDDVLTQAKATEGAELAQVVQLLKAARNSVIVLLHKG